jgi:hypothetical protein
MAPRHLRETVDPAFARRFWTAIPRSSRFTVAKEGPVLGYNPPKPGRPSHTTIDGLPNSSRDVRGARLPGLPAWPINVSDRAIDLLFWREIKRWFVFR